MNAFLFSFRSQFRNGHHNCQPPPPNPNTVLQIRTGDSVPSVIRICPQEDLTQGTGGRGVGWAAVHLGCDPRKQNKVGDGKGADE